VKLKSSLRKFYGRHHDLEYIPIHVFHIKRETELFGHVGSKYLEDKLLPSLKEKVFLPSQFNHIMRLIGMEN
jgi:hypothetical protein